MLFANGIFFWLDVTLIWDLGEESILLRTPGCDFRDLLLGGSSVIGGIHNIPSRRACNAGFEVFCVTSLNKLLNNRLDGDFKSHDAHMKILSYLLAQYSMVIWFVPSMQTCGNVAESDRYPPDATSPNGRALHLLVLLDTDCHWRKNIYGTTRWSFNENQWAICIVLLVKLSMKW